MNYEPIITKINYWKNYDGTGDAYRKTHDLEFKKASNKIQYSF